MRKLKAAAAAATLLAVSVSFAAAFPTPALADDSAPSAGLCDDPYINDQGARGRAHLYLMRRGFVRTTDGKPRVIMGDARCEDGFWRVKVTLVDYEPKGKRSETILINANSGKVIKNLGIIG